MKVVVYVAKITANTAKYSNHPFVLVATITESENFLDN